MEQIEFTCNLLIGALRLLVFNIFLCSREIDILFSKREHLKSLILLSLCKLHSGLDAQVLSES